MTSVDPARAMRRSQLYRWHQQHGAVFSGEDSSTFVDNYGDPADELSAAARLGICDLSLLPRQGITGRGSTTWLRENNYELPQRPNTSIEQVSGDLLVRLSAQEFLCLHLSCLAINSSSSQPSWSQGDDTRAFTTPRADSHCLFAIAGAHSAEMFATLCGIDLRAHVFAAGGVAQTSVARVNAIVIRHDLEKINNFYLLTPTAAAEYVWECLVDALDEFGGKTIGTAALRAISGVSA